MSNIVVITAAGIGSRTQQFIPKQFLSIKDKPLIIYTMEKFENHPDIDHIVVTCLKGWDNFIECYAKQFNITKLKKIVLGGETGFESIQNGLGSLNSFANPEDIVLIHDGNRPGVSHETISECINIAKQKGSAITCIPVNEVVFNINKDTPELINRDDIIRTQTPHAANYKYMTEIYNRAKKQNITNSVAFCSLLSKLGEEFHFIKGSEKNFKITFKEDIDLFKGLILVGENEKNEIHE